jgi:hypothetical protein
MDNFLMNVVEYFRPPESYFWRWAENGNVIEWHNGNTICYRDELVTILKHLSKEGLPSLGAVLLVLSACKDDWKDSENKIGILQGVLQIIQAKEQKRPALFNLPFYLNDALLFLDQVNGLPKSLRTGEKRNWLLYTIFEKTEKKQAAHKAQDIIEEFNRGRVDHFIFKEGLNPAGIHFKRDLECLDKALKEFPTTALLETKIKTGVIELPAPAELDAPETEPTDLLQQLEQDVKTAGLANLTQRLIAALHIPMHTQGSSDQSFGGVSDITNRGNFDRLLLSELAHDDLSLMARLANNEALYLRREELPSNLDKHQVILIDTTIKLWGIPRVFAISAALACIRNNKTKATVESFALSGSDCTPVDLSTKDGVITTLSKLDAAMHCGRSLTTFMHQRTVHEGDEFFLITDEEALHSVLFQNMLSSLKHPLSFLVTVNRNGHLQFYEFINNRRKLVSEARFDLDELLFNVKQAAKKVTKSAGLPAFLQDGAFPLFFPASKIKFNAGLFVEVRRNHMVCVTLDQRVLYWNNRNHGAMEIMGCIEKGYYCIGMMDNGTICIVVYHAVDPFYRIAHRLYKIFTDMHEVETIDLAAASPQFSEIVYDERCFYMNSNEATYIIKANTGQVEPVKEQIDISQISRLIAGCKHQTINFNPLKKFVNNGYTVINTVRTIYINLDKELGFDDRHVSLRVNSNTIIIAHNSDGEYKRSKKFIAKMIEAEGKNEHNELVRYSKFAWSDGSEILADSRGFLHLHSSDNTIPHIIILMIMNKPTACWASDGAICGPEYFTGVANEESIKVETFYKNYIERFIDVVYAYAT